MILTAQSLVHDADADPIRSALGLGETTPFAVEAPPTRVLRFRNTPVEVHNYIDDLGVQVADIIVGYTELERRDLDAVKTITDTTRFDYYCWDLYARVTAWYDESPVHLEARTRVLHEL